MGFTGVITTPFFRGVTVPLLIKMIFQLIGRFFLGAKFSWKQKKQTFALCPVTQSSPWCSPTKGERPFPERATSCQGIAIKLWIPPRGSGDFSNWQTLSIQLCPKKGINPTILLWGWDWDHQTYSREGYGCLGRVISTQPMWWFGLFKNKKQKRPVEWTKNTKSFRNSFFWKHLGFACLVVETNKMFHLNGGWVENADESHGRIRIFAGDSNKVGHLLVLSQQKQHATTSSTWCQTLYLKALLQYYSLHQSTTLTTLL